MAHMATSGRRSVPGEPKMGQDRSRWTKMRSKGRQMTVSCPFRGLFRDQKLFVFVILGVIVWTMLLDFLLDHFGGHLLGLF